jgi:hypothetical protein
VTRAEKTQSTFSVVRRLGILPQETARRLEHLLDTLRDPKILPAGARVFLPMYCRVTLVPQRVIYATLQGHTLPQMERALNRALPISARKRTTALVSRSEALHPFQNKGQPDTYRAIGVLLKSEVTLDESDSMRVPLRRRDAVLRMHALSSLALAEFEPTPKKALVPALAAINLALPEDTALPLHPVEFIPFDPNQQGQPH